jgi:predicted dehydrogenase
MKIALIGAGGIGELWSRAIKESEITPVYVVDTDSERASKLANDLGCASASDVDSLVANQVDAAIVAVPHIDLAPISAKLLQKGIHVLCEKPGGMSSSEIQANIDLAREKGLLYVPGFNHRYHPAYLEAKRRFDAGEIGDLMFVRARYGFGGRPGYEKEWRFNKKISGGGELLDQGIHMIDLARLFMGDITEVKGFAENLFWGGEVEDNGFVLLRNQHGNIAQIHVSWTNWEWVHQFEVFGTKGYLIIDGLDSRYRGPERLTIGHADPRSGEFPREEVIQYTNEKKEDSLRRELEEFVHAIGPKTRDIPTGEDAVKAMQIVEEIYDK